MPNLLNTVLIIDTSEHSDALNEIRLRPRKRSVTLAWKSGHYSTHTVARRDMFRLIDRRLTFGTWANRFVLG
jgi:hypothetical protein